jgi:glycosyltransferase involved in cell wall biosynthesis
MRVAIVHDYLNQVGGGERVLDVLLKLFPEAELYTILHDEQKTFGKYAGRVSGTSFLDIPFVRAHHQLFIPFMPLAAWSIRIPDDVDLIISATAGFAKGIRYNRQRTRHVSYVHTPLRYVWETASYFGTSCKHRLITFLGAPLFPLLRAWERWAAQRPESMLANSAYIAGKIKKYYGRRATVVYPPVADFWFNASAPRTPEGESYFLAAGRLLHYKRFDLIIDACIQAGIPLKIAGTGAELEALQQRAAQHGAAAKVEFLGYVHEEDLRDLYANAAAFIMANEEDFGLVMAEAQACGTPVIAYDRGGSREIITEDSTGVFFSAQTADSLADAIHRSQQLVFDRAAIKHSARRFSEPSFVQAIQRFTSGLDT